MVGTWKALHNGKRTEYGEKCLKNVSTVCMFQTVLFFFLDFPSFFVIAFV